MSEKVSYLIQGKNIILVVDGESYTISKETHISYSKILDAIREEDWDAVRELVIPRVAIEAFGDGNVEIKGDEVLWNGKPFHNSLAVRMVEMYKEGFPIEPMVHFVENLMENPSMRSVNQLYTFLEKNNLPITQDGHFLAYKKVKKDYTDHHSGKIDNSVGQFVEMDRNQVDDDPASPCSAGLHFCSLPYLNGFGDSSDPVLILKINPADVVSIPNDSNGSKGRCCAYLVVAEVKGDPKDAFAKVVNGEYDAPEDKDPIQKVNPVAAWPCPTSELRAAREDPVEPAPTEQLYDLYRTDGTLVCKNMTFTEASAQVAKNVRQKKAILMMVPAGTTPTQN